MQGAPAREVRVAITVNAPGQDAPRALQQSSRQVARAVRAALMEAVAYLDGKMAEIKKAGKVSGTDRIAVMAALNIAHELLSLKVGNGFDIGQAKRRISSLEAKLDAAIAQQDKLF